MKLSDGTDTRARGWPHPWRAEARKALDSWAPSTEFSVSVALDQAFRKGLAAAAEIAEKEGHPELAGKIRAFERGT